jgi:hypothetical protein
MRIRNFYIRDIRRQVGASPFWPISARYNLGDYGYYSRRTGHFSVRGNVFDDLGVPRDSVIVPPTDPPVMLYKIFNSSNTMKNEFSADVNTKPQTGKLELGFDSERGYVFHLFRASLSYIRLNEALRQKLSSAMKKGKWNHRYRLIEMLYETPDVRFAFSLSQASSIMLSGEVETGQLPARGNVNYAMRSSSNMDGSFWIENAPSTPFAKFASFKKRELKFADEKILVGDEWVLQADSSGSFDEEEELV